MHFFLHSPWVPLPYLVHAPHLLQPQTQCCRVQQANLSFRRLQRVSSYTAFPSHFLSIDHLSIPAYYLLIYPCIPSNCSPFLPFFCSYIPMLACKWLKNLSGIIAMDLSIQKNVKIKNSVLTYVTPHTCYHHLLYAGVHIRFYFPSLLHLHFLYVHTHTHICFPFSSQ